MVRNNEERFGPRNTGSDESPKETGGSPLQFVTPTEFVELPSQGRSYPEGHPLHMQETIEIRYMTAKEEDILSSRSLLKSGVALDRLIKNLIVDKSISADSLLVGDRNAIIIAARSSAYGHLYNTKVNCPSCGEVNKKSFDLTKPKIIHGEQSDEYDIKRLETGNYEITLPRSGYKVVVRLLTGKEEQYMIKQMAKKKNNVEDSLVTNQMKMFIVSVQGHNDPMIINQFINKAPAVESRYLRNAYTTLVPDIKITKDFECSSCGYEQELEVPMGADFFWPER